MYLTQTKKNLEWISPTFNEQFFLPISFQQKFNTQILL